MNIIKLIFSILAILLGAFFVVYGEYDDSPGGQLIGAVLVIVGIVFAVKSRKKIPSNQTLISSINRPS